MMLIEGIYLNFFYKLSVFKSKLVIIMGKVGENEKKIPYKLSVKKSIKSTDISFLYWIVNEIKENDIYVFSDKTETE